MDMCTAPAPCCCKVLTPCPFHDGLLGAYRSAAAVCSAALSELRAAAPAGLMLAGAGGGAGGGVGRAREAGALADAADRWVQRMAQELRGVKRHQRSALTWRWLRAWLVVPLRTHCAPWLRSCVYLVGHRTRSSMRFAPYCCSRNACNRESLTHGMPLLAYAGACAGLPSRPGDWAAPTARRSLGAWTRCGRRQNCCDDSVVVILRCPGVGLQWGLVGERSTWSWWAGKGEAGGGTRVLATGLVQFACIMLHHGGCEERGWRLEDTGCTLGCGGWGTGSCVLCGVGRCLDHGTASWQAR